MLKFVKNRALIILAASSRLGGYGVAIIIIVCNKWLPRLVRQKYNRKWLSWVQYFLENMLLPSLVTLDYDLGSHMKKYPI